MKNKNGLIVLFIVIVSITFFMYKESKNVAEAKIRNQTVKKETIIKSQSDFFYKNNIISNSKKNNFTIANMGSILCPEEIKEFIRKNDNNANIYRSETDDFRANFHIHTLSSDGQMSQETLLDEAATLAQLKGDTIYIAITDHNTTEGAKRIVEILQANPEKYKNVKIILGIEVYSTYENPNTYNPIDIHVLCWGIDPYDPELNEIFYKKDSSDKCNWSYRTFEDAIRLLTRKGIVGIAHPARYVEEKNLKTSYKKYYNALFDTYLSMLTQDTGFTEGYYQSYSGREEFEDMSGKKFNNLINLINKIASNKNIIKTGSYDSHGLTILDR